MADITTQRLQLDQHLLLIAAHGDVHRLDAIAVERGAGQAGRAYRPEAVAFWVWLVKPGDGLAFPALRFEREMVEVVRRERVAEASEA